jgi:hypothetical protein
MTEDEWWAMELEEWAPRDPQEEALKKAIADYQRKQLEGK